jgi:hypothetical protein
MLMKVHVLKVRGRDNLDEMEEGIAAGHTVDGWQMPKTATPGDLAVWYAASPYQDYRAWGWVAGSPRAGFRESDRLYVGPVAGIRRIEPVKRRQEVAEACGFNRDSVAQQAQTVPYEIADHFLRALGLDRRFVTARELISDEIVRVLSGLGTGPDPGAPGRRG